jgi:inhibitor of KinA sporulation pathway (predicted exonuclease)
MNDHMKRGGIASLVLVAAIALTGATFGHVASASPAATVSATSVNTSTAGQRNALRAAKTYLKMTPFSRKGLIQQLSSKYGDGYSVKDATWAVNRVDANWNQQALRAAKAYLKMTPFSRKGLIQQLSSKYGDRYTVAQATYAVNRVGL